MKIMTRMRTTVALFWLSGTAVSAQMKHVDIKDAKRTNGGTALPVHERADDGKTEPGGNPGTPIACGVIIK